MKNIFPEISIIIAIGPKKKRDLWRCLNSILKSSFNNWEVILVDNSGVDKLAEEIKLKFPDERIKILRMHYNSGLLGINVGFANAKGKYLMTLDDDSAVYKETLKKIIKKFQILPKETMVISCAYKDRVTNEFISADGIDLNKYFYSLTGANVYKREIFKKVGWLEDRFFLWGYEDDFVLKVLRAGFKVYHTKVDEIFVDHYSKEGKMRKLKVYLGTRNKVWLLVKYFSWDIILLLALRDLIWIWLQPLRNRSLIALYYSFKGYLVGILTSIEFIKERKVVSREVQKRYLRTQYLGDLKHLINKYG